RLPAYRRGGTPVSLKSLLDELAATRERGHCVDDEGGREGVFCVGAPVFDASGQAVAGLGMCIHKSLLDARSRQRHRNVVTGIASQITHRLGATLPAKPVRKGTA